MEQTPQPIEHLGNLYKSFSTATQTSGTTAITIYPPPPLKMAVKVSVRNIIMRWCGSISESLTSDELMWLNSELSELDAKRKRIQFNTKEEEG